jgi:hypothetical protein
VPKLTQAEVRAAADEWARLSGKVKAAEDAMNAELDPFVVEFNEKTKAVTARHDAKIGKLIKQRDELQSQVIGWLDGHGKPIALEGDLAVAANETQTSARRLDAETFFSKVKDRGKEFWACVSIGIQKADKYLGKDKVDKMATTESKLVSVLKLK